MSNEGNDRIPLEGEHPVAEIELKKVEEVPALVIEKPSEDAPLTQAEFQAQLEKLQARARAAGLRPLQVMMAAYAKRGMAVIEGVLSALEEGVPAPPVEKKEK